MKTTKELHIGLDIALQAIDSNRKLNIKPYEKDWVLNEVMYQEIVNISNALKRNKDFEDRMLYVNALETLKAYSIAPIPTLRSSDGRTFVVKPADCLTPIASQTVIIPKPFNKNISVTDAQNTNLAYAVVPFLKSSATSDYTNTIIKFDDNDVIFNGASSYDRTDNKTFTSFGDVKEDSGRFIAIPIILQFINRLGGGVSVYWEKFLNVYKPDSFIVALDRGLFDASKTTISKSTRAFNIDNTAITITIGNKSQVCKFNYVDATTRTVSDTYRRKVVPNRIVSHEDIYTINDNPFAVSNRNSTTSIIENGMLRIQETQDFIAEKVILEYYRKPVMINHVTGVTCEIQDEFFIINLVNKAALRLSARISDENYQTLSHESVLIN